MFSWEFGKGKKINSGSQLKKTKVNRVLKIKKLRTDTLKDSAGLYIDFKYTFSAISSLDQKLSSYTCNTFPVASYFDISLLVSIICGAHVHTHTKEA